MKSQRMKTVHLNVNVQSWLAYALSGGKYRRYPDGCYAVVVGKRRGPCGHDMRTAWERFRKSGLISSARTD